MIDDKPYNQDEIFFTPPKNNEKKYFLDFKNNLNSEANSEFVKNLDTTITEKEQLVFSTPKKTFRKLDFFNEIENAPIKQSKMRSNTYYFEEKNLNEKTYSHNNEKKITETKFSLNLLKNLNEIKVPFFTNNTNKLSNQINKNNYRNEDFMRFDNFSNFNNIPKNLNSEIFNHNYSTCKNTATIENHEIFNNIDCNQNILLGNKIGLSNYLDTDENLNKEENKIINSYSKIKNSNKSKIKGFTKQKDLNCTSNILNFNNSVFQNIKSSNLNLNQNDNNNNKILNKIYVNNSIKCNEISKKEILKFQNKYLVNNPIEELNEISCSTPCNFKSKITFDEETILTNKIDEINLISKKSIEENQNKFLESLNKASLTLVDKLNEEPENIMSLLKGSLMFDLIDRNNKKNLSNGFNFQELKQNETVENHLLNNIQILEKIKKFLFICLFKGFNERDGLFFKYLVIIF